MKGKMVVRPALLYGLETVALTERQEAQLEVAELKVQQFSLGMTKMDRIRIEYIRGTPQVGSFGGQVKAARLRWFEHVQRRHTGYIRSRTLRMEPPSRRRRGRPKKMFMDVVREDMQMVSVTEEDVRDGDR